LRCQEKSADTSPDLSPLLALTDSNLQAASAARVSDFGQAELRILCESYGLNFELLSSELSLCLASGKGPSMFPDSLRCLLDIIRITNPSNAACERLFSLVRRLCSKERNSLETCSLHELLHMRVNGPPVSVFDPLDLCKTWEGANPKQKPRRKRKLSSGTIERISERFHVWRLMKSVTKKDAKKN
jgi:hypothetical protein